MESRTDQMKNSAMAFYDWMFNQCWPCEAIEQYVEGSYMQHNPGSVTARKPSSNI